MCVQWGFDVCRGARWALCAGLGAVLRQYEDGWAVLIVTLPGLCERIYGNEAEPELATA